MGIVYAKDANNTRKDHLGKQTTGVKSEMTQNEQDNFFSGRPNYSNKIEIDGVKARVDRVFIDGLKRTKDDIVTSAVREIFKAKDFPEVLKYATRVRQKLEGLGCFRNIGIYIDTSRGPRATPHGLEVTFYVKEHKRIVGGISTSVGNNSEGNLVVGLRSPNILGRGERIQAEYSYGSRKTDNINIAFIKPFFRFKNSVLTTSLFQTGTEWPWSGYRQTDRGIALDFQFSSAASVKHNIQWEGLIRDLSVISRTSSFAVREHTGPKLKSAVKHILSVDHRDQSIFPTTGCLFQLTSELAGVGGDIGFLKNDILLQANYSIFDDVVLQTTLQGGFLKPTGEKSVGLPDQFYLGGPLSLRGFQTRGVGPHVDGDALGSDVFWAAAAHLYTPLPFRPGHGGFGELFRTHLFVNCGNIGNFKFNDDALHNMKLLAHNIRLAYGFGVALRLGDMARVEVNYCFPVWYRKGDIASHGVQFGVGIHFL